MATFSVPVLPVLSVRPHPDADRLDLVTIRGYECVVQKGQFEPGELCLYIPEQAILPEWLMRRIGLWDDEKGHGRLAGSKNNRVKALRLRGIVSQGIAMKVLPCHDEPNSVLVPDHEGNLLEYGVEEDAADTLGVYKWEPEIPSCMAGDVLNVLGHTIGYDIENVQSWPDILREGEEVAITEKLHGTWTLIGRVPGLGHPELLDGEIIVSCKNLSAKGLAFKWHEANQTSNIYCRSVIQLARRGIDITARLKAMAANPGMQVMVPGLKITTPVLLLGEIFGKGIQDLHYGQAIPAFRLFDVFIGEPSTGRYLDYDEKTAVAANLGIEMVPLLYKGPFSKELLVSLRDGMETLTGRRSNLREGAVFTPTHERRDMRLGRVILKSVSPAYLFRRGGGTEFQ